ncbi:hypothetical protein [sulfur-oxidizing endosymbiont of Gigantopelta aegis]|uniref:hypothetical protein n=1 Tax=sulfur-oxidizing endosymbiont of Gigantopelta aegis TaxID=2794934 RepID=UPI0018DBAD9C|nr:hypothetical protein [sulfur-oxidizing endosymbiont of Gigantopelta aegis]
MNSSTSEQNFFSFKRIIHSALAYKPQLIKANIIAIIAALLSVPMMCQHFSGQFSKYFFGCFK